MNILMVCLGNICRSPLAQGILELKASANTVFVDSAGTAGYHQGELPDSRSIKVAKAHGIDITNQRSRKFEVSDFDKFDIIYAMDSNNEIDIHKLARDDNDKLKVKLILNVLEDSSHKNVPDPYYGEKDGFEKVYNMLAKACDNIVSKLQLQ